MIRLFASRLAVCRAFPALLGALCVLIPWGALAAEAWTLPEMLSALRSGKPPQALLVKEVDTRGVSFRLGPQVRAQLVAAGAKQPLLNAIARSLRAGAGADPAANSPDAATPRAATEGTAATADRPESAVQASNPPGSAGQEPAAQDVPTFQGDAVAEMPSEPVTPQEIGAALSNHDDQVVLAAMIAARGVSFKYTPDLGRAWREAGASAELLAAVATATVTLPPVPDGFEPVPIARAADYNEQLSKGRLDLRLHVDDIVEVRLQGDRVVWKTLKGADGKDAGTEASQPFPMGPLRSLNVTKRDGRGQFVVLQQPNGENNFEMMLRIYDPRGGADRYHLRIDWEHFD